MQSLVEAFGISASVSERLVAVGINSPAAFEGVDAEALEEAGFSPEEAATIMRSVGGV